MQKTHEWGVFFPAWMSPFAYNESLAQDYFPLTSEKNEEIGGIPGIYTRTENGQTYFWYEKENSEFE